MCDYRSLHYILLFLYLDERVRDDCEQHRVLEPEHQLHRGALGQGRVVGVEDELKKQKWGK